MEFNKVLENRFSVRDFKDIPVEDEKIEKILKAGMQAPGSRLGAEPWEFIVVKNRETIDKLGEIKPRAKHAQAVIV